MSTMSRMLAVMVLCLANVRAADVEILSLADAAKQQGADKTVTVELVVKASQEMPTGKEYRLVSEDSILHEDAFAIVLSEKARAALPAEDLGKHFQGKKVRATGKVSKSILSSRPGFRPVIVIDDPKQFMIVETEEKPDETTRVKAAVRLPAELESFANRTLELRLYSIHPLLADAAADLVEKFENPKFTHTKGQATELDVEVGAKGKLDPQRTYYVTLFVLDGDKRTHMGEKDGKAGLCKVLTAGNPREVTLQVRAVK